MKTPPATPMPPRRSAAAPADERALRGVLSQELWAGRTVLYVREIARALHVTEQHVVNLITEGRLRAINVGNGVSSSKATRDYWRIPVGAWDAYIQENAS